MELNEYRQITGGIGVALFVAGMAVWPAGVTAKSWNWALWCVGVFIAVFGVYVFTVAMTTSRALWLPVKSKVVPRMQTRALVDAVLAVMRIEGSELDLDDWRRRQDGDLDTRCNRISLKDVWFQTRISLYVAEPSLRQITQSRS